MLSRRDLLRGAVAACALLPGVAGLSAGLAGAAAAGSSRVRPGEPGWPSDAAWERLNDAVGGRLLALRSPLQDCADAGVACEEVFARLRNPYYLGDEPALTQSLGWVDAWTSRPSVYAVAAERAEDIVAAVDFARRHNLRLVVKGGGHSYQGTSSSPDSLLTWLRRLNRVELHEDFVPAGCEGRDAPRPAVTVEAGALWAQVYDAVTTQGGRYVQGGGCLTVGVAGLVQSGGFGSFSKAYGLAAASLLEAEVVTADGELRTANACINPDLFWALKGGGGGSFGVLTRLTLATHALPETFGAVFAEIRATSDDAYRRLIDTMLRFYRESLFNPQWGEQFAFGLGNRLSLSLLFQGLERAQAEAVWQPFFAALAASPDDFSIESGPDFISLPARRLWDPAFLKEMGGVVLGDDRPGAPPGNIYWAGNRGEAGQVLHGYQSAWLPASLLHPDAASDFVEALFAASRHWRVGLHCNKGLAGAPPEVIAAAAETAINPAVLEAFALVICGAEGSPAYPGIPGHEPDVAAARRQAARIDAAMKELRGLLPDNATYVAESDFFQPNWQDAFWGENYARLREIKQRYDPLGLFVVHHGVGSEDWSADGFTRVP